MMKYLFVLLCVISVCTVIEAHPTPDNSSEEPVSQEVTTPDGNASESVTSSVEEITFEENGESNKSTETTSEQSTPPSSVDQGYYNLSSRCS